jgi:hypothetical protein
MSESVAIYYPILFSTFLEGIRAADMHELPESAFLFERGHDLL